MQQRLETVSKKNTVLLNDVEKDKKNIKDEVFALYDEAKS